MLKLIITLMIFVSLPSYAKQAAVSKPTLDKVPVMPWSSGQRVKYEIKTIKPDGRVKSFMITISLVGQKQKNFWKEVHVEPSGKTKQVQEVYLKHLTPSPSPHLFAHINEIFSLIQPKLKNRVIIQLGSNKPFSVPPIMIRTFKKAFDKALQAQKEILAVLKNPSGYELKTLKEFSIPGEKQKYKMITQLDLPAKKAKLIFSAKVPLGGMVYYHQTKPNKDQVVISLLKSQRVGAKTEIKGKPLPFLFNPQKK